LSTSTSPLPPSNKSAKTTIKERIGIRKGRTQESSRMSSSGTLGSAPPPKVPLKRALSSMPSNARSCFDWVHVPYNHTGWVFVSKLLATHDFQ
jgi:hypothetical protein